MNRLTQYFCRFPTGVVFGCLIVPFFFANVGPIGRLSVGFVLIAWLFTTWFSLRSASPFGRETSTIWFLARLLYALVYITVLELAAFDRTSGVAMACHLLAVLCVFSCLYSVAKLLVLSEAGKKQCFDRYIGTFLLFWFYPIGVWFLHPRIRKALSIQ